MSDIAVRIDHVSKRYRLGQRERYGALRDLISGGVSRSLQRARAGVRRQLSIQRMPRTARAISGRSATSRSTCAAARWSASSAATAPARARCSRSSRASPSRPPGEVEIHGRVGSLLEVGTGFHPGADRPREHLPQRRHPRHAHGARSTASSTRSSRSPRSSSSSTRRSSATPAACTCGWRSPSRRTWSRRSCIVDEVLAVGDAAFQKKCLGKMGDVAAQGRTVLFVSHNMPAVAGPVRAGHLDSRRKRGRRRRADAHRVRLPRDTAHGAAGALLGWRH